MLGVTSGGGIAIGVGAVIFVLVVSRYASGSGQVQKDSQRAFTSSQRTAAFARAGNQCEHFGVFGRRCTASPSHADHVYPHSKGGATTLSNCQALCARHNLAKSNHVPSRLHVTRLERRRASYFPPGTPVDVSWKVGY